MTTRAGGRSERFLGAVPHNPSGPEAGSVVSHTQLARAGTNLLSHVNVSDCFEGTSGPRAKRKKADLHGW